MELVVIFKPGILETLWSFFFYINSEYHCSNINNNTYLKKPIYILQKSVLFLKKEQKNLQLDQGILKYNFPVGGWTGAPQCWQNQLLKYANSSLFYPLYSPSFHVKVLLWRRCLPKMLDLNRFVTFRAFQTVSLHWHLLHCLSRTFLFLWDYA